MYTVHLLRKIGALEQTYGSVVFDGNMVTYRGLTSVFEKQLDMGIIAQNGRRYTPSDGIEFLRNLRTAYRDPSLRATNVTETQ